MTLQVKCIEKIRNKNNHIIEYKLISNDKKTISVKSDDLKESIRSGQLEVTNLTLTSDNRLVAKKLDIPSKPINNMESLLNRVKSVGYTLNTFDTACGHKCYIASSPDNTKHMFILPDDVKYIYSLSDPCIYISDTELYKYISNIKGTLKIIGGKSLVSTRSMFRECKVQSIDLSSFDTSNVTNMNYMFEQCEVHSIDLSSFNTSNVTNMSGMFTCCITRSLDLRSFNTSKVTDMSFMFQYCKAPSIDLSSFNTSRVTDMKYMFKGCTAQYLDLRSFNTSKVTDMYRMFNGCEAQFIDISSFDTSRVIDASSMFIECESQINVNNFKLKYQLQKDRKWASCFK